VGKALERGCSLADLTLDDFRAVDTSLDASVYEILGVEKAIAAFKSYGSTAPSEVRKQIQRWKTKLALP
jgi:argininosuccinate lyase